MKNKILDQIIPITLGVIVLFVGGLFIHPSKAQSQEKRTPSGTAFIVFEQGNADDLVVYIVSVSDSYASLLPQLRHAPMAQAVEVLRGAGLRLVQTDGTICRFETP